MDMHLIETASGTANPRKRWIVNPADADLCFGFLSNKRIPLASLIFLLEKV